MKKIVSLVLTLCLMLAMAVVPAASLAEPEATLSVAHYNVATGVYEMGSMSTKQHFPKYDGFSYGTYTVLDEDTFVVNGAEVAAVDAANCVLIQEANDDVLADTVRMGNSVEPFGRIDSEAWDKGLTISPYSTPILESRGLEYSPDRLWLAIADTNGTVIDVYIVVVNN